MAQVHGYSHDPLSYTSRSTRATRTSPSFWAARIGTSGSIWRTPAVSWTRTIVTKQRRSRATVKCSSGATRELTRSRCQARPKSQSNSRHGAVERRLCVALSLPALTVPVVALVARDDLSRASANPLSRRFPPNTSLLKERLFVTSRLQTAGILDSGQNLRNLQTARARPDISAVPQSAPSHFQ